MSPTIYSQTKQLSRYRVTLDVLVDPAICDTTSNWDWEDFIGLSESEALNDVYVEDLGEYNHDWWIYFLYKDSS